MLAAFSRKGYCMGPLERRYEDILSGLKRRKRKCPPLACWAMMKAGVE